ncbi:MAG: DUF882 domain-containing protein [Rhodospirillaceae bacterium]
MTIENKRSDPTMPVARRDFLRLGTVAAIAVSAAALVPTDALAFPNPGKIHRQLAFINQHTSEHLNTEYWAKGHYRRDALRAVNRLFRDHRTGAVHSIDPRLLDVVYHLKKRVGAHGPFHIVSGYRSPATNAMLMESDHPGVARHSYHVKGMAVDLYLPGYSLDRLHRAALALRAGGVGYYPDNGFIHLDVGPLRRWEL